LVTGATSGIGRAYAVSFAKAGYDLIITGRRMDKLNALAHELREQCGICVRIIKAELSDDQDTQKLIKSIESRDNIHILVNNAGFGSGVEFCKNKLADHMRMLQVHVVVSIKLVYAVLPQMISRKEGAIINVSSLGAFIPAPGSSIYSATKLFLASFTESLHMEVHKHGIRVQCICPGFTYSNFHERRDNGKVLKAGKFMWMEPDTLVAKSIKSLNHSNIVLVPGIINKLLIRIVALIPRRLYYFIMERSGNVKFGPGLFDRVKQFIEKAVPFFFTTRADQV
jgi:short-subunit dehydrogenase